MTPYGLICVSDRNELIRTQPKPINEIFNSIWKAALLQFALPYGSHTPSNVDKALGVLMITANVLIELALPKLTIANWRGRVSASFMPMPEAAMNKDNGSPFGKDNIWRARQAPIMESKAKAFRMECLANEHFGLGVSALDPGHHAGSGFASDNIHDNENAPGKRPWID